MRDRACAPPLLLRSPNRFCSPLTLLRAILGRACSSRIQEHSGNAAATCAIAIRGNAAEENHVPALGQASPHLAFDRRQPGCLPRPRSVALRPALTSGLPFRGTRGVCHGKEAMSIGETTRTRDEATSPENSRLVRHDEGRFARGASQTMSRSCRSRCQYRYQCQCQCQCQYRTRLTRSAAATSAVRFRLQGSMRGTRSRSHAFRGDRVMPLRIGYGAGRISTGTLSAITSRVWIQNS